MDGSAQRKEERKRWRVVDTLRSFCLSQSMACDGKPSSAFIVVTKPQQWFYNYILSTWQGWKEMRGWRREHREGEWGW